MLGQRESSDARGDRVGCKVRLGETSRSSAKWLAIGSLAVAAACGGGPGPGQPVPVLALSSAHQQAWYALEERFATASKKERAAMAAELETFSRRSSNGRSARPLHAWALLEKGELGRAEALARQVEQGSPGTVRDAATVVRGAALRRKGEAVEALATLAPLVGKVIDPYVLDLLNEEIAIASLEAKRYDEALEYMVSWLRDTEGARRKVVLEEIERSVARIPKRPLLSFLESRRDLIAVKEATAAVSTIVARRLAKRAGDEGDVALARQLLEGSRDLLGDEGDTVAELAVGQHAARLDPGIVGVLLPMGDAVLRRRGIELASGVGAALGGPSAPIRVLTRDDGGDVSKTGEALQALSALGAAVVLAGFDEPGATAAARFAEEQGLVVLLLRPPRGGLPPSAFRVGPDPREVQSKLRAALAERGETPAAGVVDEVSLAEATVAGSEPEPLCDTWTAAGARDRGARGVVVLGDVACGRRVAEDAAGARLGLAFGLEAAEAAPTGAFYAAAGVYPLAEGPPPPGLRDAGAMLGDRPTFWAALGRDAGTLARAALEPMLADPPAEADQVDARRGVLIEALSEARAELWTTSSRGFSADRTLPRNIDIRSR